MYFTVVHLIEYIRKEYQMAPNFTNSVNFVFRTILIINSDYFQAQHRQFVCITETVCVYSAFYTVYLYVVYLDLV
jgi:hypothetical protein